jgi:hypothetical protein
MSVDTTPTTLKGSEAQITLESEDTPKGSFGFRPLPTPLVCLLATTPVGGLSAYDLFTRDLLIGPNTISMEEESNLALMNISSDSDIAPREQSPEISQADAVNRTRLELLARQYVNKLSPEEDARLSIVTERVRRLIPRVTVEDFETLERIAERLQRIGSDDSDRRNRLGLRNLRY